MKIVIDIPEKYYNQYIGFVANGVATYTQDIIANGKVLPKGQRITHDEIVDLWQQRPPLLNPKVKRKNNYQTYKDRAYANGWNDCMREWRVTFDALDKVNMSGEDKENKE